MPNINKTRFLILGILNRNPCTGYDIKKWTETKTNLFWTISYGQIYPTLKSLQADHLVASEEVTNDKGPNSTLYKITATGKDTLLEWYQTPLGEEKVKMEILLRLSLSTPDNLEDLLSIFEEVSHQNKVIIDKLGEKEQMFKAASREKKEMLAHQLTVNFGHRFYQMYNEWIEDSTEILSKHWNP